MEPVATKFSREGGILGDMETDELDGGDGAEKQIKSGRSKQ